MSTTKKKIFRQVSLDRLSSPEQLDQLMQVTRPRSWISLVALVLVFAGALVWGVTGRISEKVVGQGILVKSGGIFHVAPTRAGRVTDIAVSVGDSVAEGQVIARIAQPDLADRVAQARAALERLEIEHRQATSYGSADRTLQLESIELRRSNLVASIEAGQQNLAWLRETESNQEQLVEQGLITRQTLLNTRESVNRAAAQIREDGSRLLELDSEEMQIASTSDRETQERVFAIEGARRDLDEAERQLNLSAEVMTPYTGRVIEVLVEQGYIVNAGEPVLALHLTGRTAEDLRAVIYVPSSHGKKLRQGMTVHISPATVQREEYGLMIGSVTYVSEFPATPSGMQRVLKNDALVAALANGDAPHEVHAELLPDPSTVSRYRWTSAAGPPLTVQSGTMSSGEIVLDSTRPISRALPILRSYVQN